MVHKCRYCAHYTVQVS